MALIARIRAITQDPDFASQLTAIVTEQSLNPEQASAVFDTLNPDVLQRELAFIKAVNETAKYEGFNPREIIRLMLEHFQVAKIRFDQDPTTEESVDTVVRVDGNDAPFKFTNHEAFHKDVQFICLMFITRGAAYDKIMRKSSDTMKACMRMLKNKYNINTTQRRPGQSLDSKTITIPRIAASFPLVTVGLFHAGFGRTVYDISSLFPGVVVPRAILSPMIASMLPQTADAPLALVLTLTVKTDDILHQTGEKTPLMSLYQYMMASYNSTATTSLVRLKQCAAWELGERHNGDFIYSDVVSALREPSKNMIRALRPLDPELATVLNKI